MLLLLLCVLKEAELTDGEPGVMLHLSVATLLNSWMTPSSWSLMLFSARLISSSFSRWFPLLLTWSVVMETCGESSEDPWLNWAPLKIQKLITYSQCCRSKKAVVLNMRLGVSEFLSKSSKMMKKIFNSTNCQILQFHSLYCGKQHSFVFYIVSRYVIYLFILVNSYLTQSKPLSALYTDYKTTVD